MFRADWHKARPWKRPARIWSMPSKWSESRWICRNFPRLRSSSSNSRYRWSGESSFAILRDSDVFLPTKAQSIANTSTSPTHAVLQRFHVTVRSLISSLGKFVANSVFRIPNKEIICPFSGNRMTSDCGSWREIGAVKLWQRSSSRRRPDRFRNISPRQERVRSSFIKQDDVLRRSFRSAIPMRRR